MSPRHHNEKPVCDHAVWNEKCGSVERWWWDLAFARHEMRFAFRARVAHFFCCGPRQSSPTTKLILVGLVVGTSRQLATTCVLQSTYCSLSLLSTFYYSYFSLQAPTLQVPFSTESDTSHRIDIYVLLFTRDQTHPIPSTPPSHLQASINHTHPQPWRPPPPS